MVETGYLTSFLCCGSDGNCKIRKRLSDEPVQQPPRSTSHSAGRRLERVEKLGPESMDLASSDA
jgi:hypothetical protein